MADDSNNEQKKSEAYADALNQMQDFRHRDFLLSMVDQLSKTLENKIAERSKYYNELAKLRSNYLVNGIYDIISNDVFVDSGLESYLSVDVPSDQKLAEELQTLFYNLNIPELVISIFPDLLHYGAYPLKPVVDDKEGLVALDDAFDPQQVISVTQPNNKPLFYFVSDKKTDDRGFIDYTKRQSFQYASISEVMYFSLDLEHIKLSIPDKLVSQMKNKVPRDLSKSLPTSLKIKQSKSFIWGGIDKIKETLLLERIGNAKTLATALSPSILGIPVPDMYEPDKLVKITAKYDELVNGGTSKLNSLENPDLALQDIANVKVIPIAGDKGIPSPIDTGSRDRGIDPQIINTSRENALNSLGIPVELFDGTARDIKTNLKNNIRYAKKIKKIQKNISKSLINLCLLHISKVHPRKDISSSDINIQLKNNINIDELENLESQDLLISSVGSVDRMFDDLSRYTEGTKYGIDREEFLSKVKDSLSMVGSQYANVIAEMEDEEEEPQPPLDDDNVPPRSGENRDGETN